MAKTGKHSAQSIRQRLLNISRRKGQVFDVILVNFGLERFLYRLSKSEHQNTFVLKGGVLVTLLIDDESRVTRDVDFLGYGDSSIDHLKSVISGIMNIEVDDGIRFDTDSMTAETIRQEMEYGGIRLKAFAYLDKTRIPITIDIGFGDALLDTANSIEIPSSLGLPTANIRAYPVATVVAEKFQAIVALGMANSRMKDYYDLWAIHVNDLVRDGDLDAALGATFSRRDTVIPETIPEGLSGAFTTDAQKLQQWAAYASSIGVEELAIEDVADTIWSYIGPACSRLTKESTSDNSRA